MALCFLQEIGLADDVLVDEQDIPAPALPDTRLLRDTPVRRTLPSNIYSSCLVSSTYFSQTRFTHTLLRQTIKQTSDIPSLKNFFINNYRMNNRLGSR